MTRRGFDVVIPACGLCSYVALHCRDEQRIPDVARASAEVIGVDFAIYRDGNEVVIESDRGHARIQSVSDSLQYVPATDYPLALESLRHGFKTNKDWLDSTAAHRYPDAVPNLYKSLFSPRVQDTADILISLRAPTPSS